MGFPIDDDSVLASGETLRQAKSRGGKSKAITSLETASRGKKKGGRKAKGTTSDVNWPAIREQWMTGRYSKPELAEMFGVPIGTLKSQAHRDRWPSRPLGPMVQQVLPSLAEAADPNASPETIERLLAAAEGREVNEEASDRERAVAAAQRKASVLRRHRNIADLYFALAVKTTHLLSDYADGKMSRSFVKTKDPDGKDVNVPFHLISKAHGFSDGVYRVGMILQRAVSLDRMVNALENVDGDGNPIGSGGAGASDQVSALTTDELERKLEELLDNLKAPGRVTALPPGLATGFPSELTESRAPLGPPVVARPADPAPDPFPVDLADEAPVVVKAMAEELAAESESFDAVAPLMELEGSTETWQDQAVDGFEDPSDA